MEEVLDLNNVFERLVNHQNEESNPHEMEKFSIKYHNRNLYQYLNDFYSVYNIHNEIGV